MGGKKEWNEKREKRGTRRRKGGESRSRREKGKVDVERKKR